MKIFSQSVFILWRNREKFVQLLLNIFFMFKEICGRFWEYFMFLKERVAAFEKISKKYPTLKDIFVFK